MINKEPNKNQIKETINNPTKQRIIIRLRTNGRSNFGSIIKDLSLGTRNGIMHILELKNIGIIKYVYNTTLIELDEELIESLY